MSKKEYEVSFLRYVAQRTTFHVIADNEKDAETIALGKIVVEEANPDLWDEEIASRGRAFLEKIRESAPMDGFKQPQQEKKMKAVNAKGKEQIRQFLAEFHKKRDTFTDAMIDAWAADAEQSMLNGNPPMIEICSWESVSGHTETFEIDADGTYEIDI